MMPEILHAIENAEQHADELQYIAELEKRSMSSWTDAELETYKRLTGQDEYER